MLSKGITAIAAAALIGASSGASAQPVFDAPAELRASAQSPEGSELGPGSATIYVVGLILLAIVVWAAMEVFENELPDSP